MFLIDTILSRFASLGSRLAPLLPRSRFIPLLQLRFQSRLAPLWLVSRFAPLVFHSHDRVSLHLLAVTNRVLFAVTSHLRLRSRLAPLGILVYHSAQWNIIETGLRTMKTHVYQILYSQIRLSWRTVKTEWEHEMKLM